MDRPVIDIELVRRLERAEAAANAAYVEARHALQPETGATWIEVAGAYALFDGVGSPLTQTFGIGLFDPFLDAQFDAVEQFFRAFGADTAHEVCSFAADAISPLLQTRSYTAIEQSVVLVRPTASTEALPSPIQVRAISETEAELWSRTAALGWSSESAELAQFIEEMGRVIANAHGVTCFLAELDGNPIAAAALNVSQGVALLAGASTIPAARKRGAQQSLLKARLDFAAARGVEQAMIVTQPGSGSQRNSERQGFRPVYTRTKWLLRTENA